MDLLQWRVALGWDQLSPCVAELEGDLLRQAAQIKGKTEMDGMG